MSSFTEEQLERQIPMTIGWLLTELGVCKGRQELYTRQRPEMLETLRQAAIIQSTESSNRIEGVTVDKKRLAPLVMGKVKPKDRGGGPRSLDSRSPRLRLDLGLRLLG